MAHRCVAQLSRSAVQQQTTSRGATVFSQRQSLSFKATRGTAHVVRAKKDIHPEIYKNAKVFCNGEEVMAVSGTQPEYRVEIWSGNHPFYLGSTNTVVTDEGRVNRFKRRFEGLSSLANIQTISDTREPMEDGESQEMEKAGPKVARRKKAKK